MEGRQNVLAMAQRLVGIRDRLPIDVEWEDNKFDPHALAVFIPTRKDGFGDYVAWEKAGYILAGDAQTAGLR